MTLTLPVAKWATFIPRQQRRIPVSLLQFVCSFHFFYFSSHLSLDPCSPYWFLYFPPILLEHCSWLSDQPEPMISPLWYFICPLELFLVFVLVYSTCTSDSTELSSSSIAAAITLASGSLWLTPQLSAKPIVTSLCPQKMTSCFCPASQGMLLKVSVFHLTVHLLQHSARFKKPGQVWVWVPWEWILCLTSWLFLNMEHLHIKPLWAHLAPHRRCNCHWKPRHQCHQLQSHGDCCTLPFHSHRHNPGSPRPISLLWNSASWQSKCSTTHFHPVYFSRRRNNRLPHQAFHLSLCTACSPASVLKVNLPSHSVVIGSFSPSKLQVSLHLSHMICANCWSMSICLHRTFQHRHICVFYASHLMLRCWGVRHLSKCDRHPPFIIRSAYIMCG